MSTDENTKDDSDLVEKSTETQTKPAKDRKNRKDKVKPMTKVIIRHLPPTMTEEEFLKQIDPVPDHDYFYFVPADWSLGVNATGRAYINFSNQNDIFIFRDKFDGYVFVDTRGTEYLAIVEFAPFQGLPKGKSRKKDQKVDTIETEQHYLAFLESIKDEDVDGKSEMKMEYSFQIKDDQKITSTPLLEYLANVRQERRDERKRKMEDRKRQREEEKQRKKNQLVKSMPKTIEEDAKENNDGIIVRTIKSRPLDRDRNKKNADQSGNKMDKTKESKTDGGSSRSEREEQRNKERQARRKEERERMRKAKEAKKADSNIKRENTTIEDPVNIKDGNDTKEPKDSKDDREKVKKYSESRRERRSRALERERVTNKSTNDQKYESQSNATATATMNEKAVENGQENPIDYDDDDKYQENRDKKDRERSTTVRNVRNKDRPSLQIYQPGKRRNQMSSQDHLDKESKSLPQSGTDDSEKQASDSSIKRQSSSKSGDRSKNNENDAIACSSQESRKKLSSEKRVSRYSEKRRAKERRDLNTGEDATNDSATTTTAGDCNSIIEIFNNEAVQFSQ